MNLTRRQFLDLAAATAALPSLSGVTMAQSYPAKPVRILVGFAAGGVTDILARLTSQLLTERLGQQFLVENRTGAGTNIATEAVVRAPADGYTLLMATNANSINATLYENLNFNFIRDLAPVAMIADVPFIMLVNPLFPAQSVSELIAYAKANPGKINYASAGIGSPPHVAGELFKMMAGVDMIQIPYRGDAPAITDLIGQQVQLYFGTLGGSIEYIRSGRLHPLAVTTKTRVDALPNVPTVGDALPGFEVGGWDGICAPRDTPPEIIETLNRQINAGLTDPALKARFAELGLTVLVGSSAAFKTLIADDTEKWAKVIRAANIKAE